MPNDQASNLQSCGNTAFREPEVTIDGQPAGLAPVYPWIYTGGIDPFLWEPIPGVQTLNFKPYRVDLTPFAGLLSDGNPHTIGDGVYNANSYFLATADLLAFTDHGSQQVTGAIISNTLSAAPTPVVTENITNPSTGAFTGNVAVASDRKLAIRGYVNTSHGRIETTVNQKVDFFNNQQFDITATVYHQTAQQSSTVTRATTRDGFFVNSTDQHSSYPLTVDFSFVANADGSSSQTTTIDQKGLLNESRSFNGERFSHNTLHNEVSATDTLLFDPSGKFLGPSGSKTTQTYRLRGPDDRCYSRTITAADQKLTSVTDGRGCEDEGGDHNNH